MMKHIIKNTLKSLLLLCALGATILAFFLFTTTGLKTIIHLGSIYLQHPIKAHEVKGRLFDTFQLGELQLNYQDHTIVIKKMYVNWHLKSLLKSQLPIDSLLIEHLELIQKDEAQKVEHIVLSGLLTKNQISLDSFTADYANARVLAKGEVATQSPYATQAKLTISSITKTQPKLAGAFSIQGTIDALHWYGNITGLGTIAIQGSLLQAKNIEQSIRWNNINWPLTQTPQFSSEQGALFIKGTLPNVDVQLDTKIAQTSQNPWHITAQAQGSVPWQWNFNVLLNPPTLSSTRPDGLYSAITLKGSINNPQNASITLQAAPGVIKFTEQDSFSEIAFSGMLLTAQLSDKGLSGQGVFTLDEQKKINLNLQLPGLKPLDGVDEQQKISAQVSASINSLDFLSQFITGIKDPKGALQVELNANGTLKNPQIETKATLKQASIELPELGMQLKAIQCDIHALKDRWSATGSIGLGGQTLLLKGDGLLAPSLNASIELTGDSLPIIDTYEYQINASPKLQIKYDKELLDIAGTITIPHAKIKIQSFSNSISLSKDAVFEKKKEQEKKARSTINSQMNVAVTMGDDVDLTAQGLHATLTGTVYVKQAPQGAMTATGELNVVQGKYKAYGQNLTIEQGELFFTGGAIDNPGINVRASKNITTAAIETSGTTQLVDFNSNNLQNANLRGNITVGVEVTGRLTDPEIQLFSTPAILSQADILSMMILGRPASQANKAGAQLLLAAISSMDLGKNTHGTQMLEQLKHSLGVDFDIETNSNYNLLTNTVSDKTAFVVRKSISDRLSIGYNVGLSQTDPNVVTLKYLLNKFFSVQVSTSSSNSGLDVLYTSHSTPQKLE